MPSTSSLKLYRSRVKRSLCRKAKKSVKRCRRIQGCKFVSGTKRRFCRKKRNTRKST